MIYLASTRNERLMDYDFSSYWENSDICQGDTLLIHSSMKRAFRELIRRKVEPSSEILIQSLLRLVGKKGTLIFPLFNFEFPTTKFFSMKNTPSQMGKITEDARQQFTGYRTGHPIYSFYAIGEHAREFRGIDNKSGYAPDSPFGKLLQLDAKIAVVDLTDQDSMTLYHHVEEMNNVDYRYFKEFHGQYEDWRGEITQRTYQLFVRDLEKGIQTDVDRMGEILWQKAVYTGNRPGINNGMRIAKAREIYRFTEIEIREGRAHECLYSIRKD